MNNFLGCYLEHFNQLPRNSLHDRRKRYQMVDYVSTLIEGCCKGEDSDPQETTKETIITLIRYHDQTKSTNGSVCLMGKYHNILYVALKLCYNWRLKDTGTVCTLLEHIYACEGTFERLFIGAIFGTKAPHYIAGWKSDFDDQDENLRAAVFFLEHATNAELELSFGAEQQLFRFVDVPIESCGKASLVKISVQLGLPDKLIIFLRFGALVNNKQREPVTVVEHILNRLMEFNRVYPFNLVACLQLLLRVVPVIKIEGIVEKYGDLIEDGLLPMSRCGINAPELKHLCRCVIRQRLWENYQLPSGLREVSVPESLRKYLDILED